VSGESSRPIPETLRSLAALLRAGMSLTTAVHAWPRHCPVGSEEPVTAAARRVALGASPADAFDAMSPWIGAEVAATVASIARLHAASGCDAARLLEAAARSVERRSRLSREASIAASGTKLSGKIVAALPLIGLPLVPAAGGALLDRRGSLMLVCGLLLLLGGAWWIGRLLPHAPEADEVAELAALLAAALGSGAGVRDAMGLCLGAGGALVDELALCARRVGLGVEWATAMAMSSHDGLQAMAAVLRRGDDLGIPVARSLEAFAERRIEDAEAVFDKRVRRAPVLMVLPLTICILPAYVLLAIGPILRGLSLG
jgi:tight adherence protein B